MKLKNNMILVLAQAGCLNMTANTIDAIQAYKVIKFRRAIQKAFGALQDGERAILDECGLSVGNDNEIIGSDAAKEKFAKLRIELYNDEAELGEIRPVPYETWHELKKENKGLGGAYIEDNLEGVLWAAPAE